MNWNYIMLGTFQYHTTYYFQYHDSHSLSLAVGHTQLWSSLFTKDFKFFYQSRFHSYTVLFGCDLKNSKQMMEKVVKRKSPYLTKVGPSPAKTQ